MRPRDQSALTWAAERKPIDPPPIVQLRVRDQSSYLAQYVGSVSLDQARPLIRPQALPSESLLFYVLQLVRCFRGSPGAGGAVYRSRGDAGFVPSQVEGRRQQR